MILRLLAVGEVDRKSRWGSLVIIVKVVRAGVNEKGPLSLF